MHGPVEPGLPRVELLAAGEVIPQPRLDDIDIQVRWEILDVFASG